MNQPRNDAETTPDHEHGPNCDHDHDHDHDHDDDHEHGPDCDHGPMPYVRESPKIGRNEPCSCGSGKKFKKCCG